MKRVLLTGAGGFVGGNLIRRLLQDNYEVHGVIRRETHPWRLEDIENRIVLHRGDLGDVPWIDQIIFSIRPQIIVHLAQYGGYPFQKDVEQAIQTNFIATTRLIAAAEKAQVERFIHTGSSSEYGTKRSPMKETDLLEPNSVYGVSKAAATLYAAHRGRDAGFPMTILRLFSVYGPWEEPGRLMPTVLLRALDGKEVEFASPSIARDFTYIDDVVDAYVKAIENPPGGGKIINVCTGIQQTLKDVAEAVIKNVERPVAVKWGIKEVGRNFDTDIWVGDPTVAAEVMGWRASVTLGTGLSKMLSWLKNNKSYYENVHPRRP